MSARLVGHHPQLQQEFLGDSDSSDQGTVPLVREWV